MPGVEASTSEGPRFPGTSRVVTSLAQLRTWATHKHSRTKNLLNCFSPSVGLGHVAGKTAGTREGRGKALGCKVVVGSTSFSKTL